MMLLNVQRIADHALHQADTVAYDDRIMPNLHHLQRVPMGDVFRLGQGTLAGLAPSEE